MRLLRHLRRLHARWRLHRMEWNNYYRPLEPPKGYEKYYTIEEALPAMKETASLKEIWELPRERKIKFFKLAWRIYRHSWKYDPEVARILDDVGLIKMDPTDQQVQTEMKETIEKGMDHAQNLRQRALKSVNIIQTEFEDIKPELKELGQDRVRVLQDALREFSEGYVEASQGQYRPPWDQEDADDPIFQSDNRPLRYQVVTSLEKHISDNDDGHHFDESLDQREKS